MQVYGYACLPKKENNNYIQAQALKHYGCTQIICEDLMEQSRKQNKLSRLLDEMQNGDSLVICKLEHLAQSITQLVRLTSLLTEKGIHFVSMEENIDTHTTLGQSYLDIMAYLAKMETNVMRARTVAGLEAAKLNGRYGGRPQLDEKKINEILHLYFSQRLLPKDIAAKTKVSETSVRKYIAKEKQKRLETETAKKDGDDHAFHNKQV